MLCVVLAGCGDRAAYRDAVGHAEDTGSYGIEWYAGSVESAFDLARSQGTPVLLYWGADWCPPCNRLKATVFNRREFIERTRLFVPVSLDGDDPGAQRLGERFDVVGYPTTIVFSPDGQEITRLALGLDLTRHLEALNLALEATRPVAAAYDAALKGDATRVDYRLLAYYSWGQDRERLVPEAQLPDALRKLYGRIPDELAVERALLFIRYLTAYGSSANEEDREPELPAEERPAAQEWMIEILQDPALAAAVQHYVVYGAHWLLPMIAQPDDAGRADLENKWKAAIERIRNAPETSPADRVATYFGEICLIRARQPEAALPASLVREARGAVMSAARNTVDPYARLALFSSAWLVLAQVGNDGRTWGYVMDEAEDSHAPDYVMSVLAASYENKQTTDMALYWRQRAWKAATGPATRFGRGTRYVQALLSAARGAPIEAVGHTDLLVRNDRRERQRIMQADQILFLRPAQAIPRGNAIEVGTDALPDVVLEVDNTTDVRRGKLGLYDSWGFPEVWVEVPDEAAPSRPASLRPGLTIHVMEHGGLRRTPVSHTFPGWTAQEIHRALNEPELSEESAEILDRVGSALGAAEGTGPDDDPFLRRQLGKSHAAGHAEGRAEAQRANALKVLKARGISVSPSLSERLAEMAEGSERLLDAALECRDEEHFLRVVSARK